jgi:CheY-like chemotaxis protein
VLNTQCKGILVVEDDDNIRDTVRQILELEGYKVHVAENGKRAIEVLENLKYPCLILLDLMMPVMNGWQFLEARKKNTVIADLPVIVVSAVGEQAQGAGATEIMRKPPDIDSLLETVSHHCAPVEPPLWPTPQAA